MRYTKKLLAYFIVNTFVLWIANYLAPDFFVFGRGQIPFWQALFTTAAGLMIAVMIYDLVLYDFKIKLAAQQYITLEALVDIGTLYLFARTPLQNSIGVGIGAFWMAIIVGIGISAGQYITKRFVDERLK